MRKAKVSIIIAAYNAAQFLPETLGSVLSQVYPDWECIVVDDGSTDGTASVVKSFVAMDKRFKYYSQENKKQGAARNLAVTNSEGLYLAFLDADDLWLKNKLQLQVETLEKESVDLVYSSGFYFGQVNKEIKVSTVKLKGADGLKSVLIHNCIALSSVLMRKKVFEQLGGFTENHMFYEDFDLWVRFYKEGFESFGIGNRFLFKYRIHSTQESAESYLQNTVRALNVINRFNESSGDNELALKAKKEHLKRLIDQACSTGKKSLVASAIDLYVNEASSQFKARLFKVLLRFNTRMLQIVAWRVI